jgi:hypothetical protein
MERGIGSNEEDEPGISTRFYPRHNSTLIFVAARLGHITGTTWSSKCSPKVQLLRELEVIKEFEAA